jgi:putative transposase
MTASFQTRMTRPLRIQFPGAVYHLTARGNVRQDVFLDDTDCHVFLALLGRVVQQRTCYAYCLMSNHYHLLIATPEGNLVWGMQHLNGTYTQAVNRRHDRVGHVLQGCSKSIVVDRDAYLLALCRYIALNPVRAHVVAAVDAWPWSSYRATAGHSRPPAWLETDWLLSHFAAIRKATPAAGRAPRWTCKVRVKFLS